MQRTEPPPQARFTADTERFRRELLAHCYRMVGSAHDAEDLVQETYLRAWRAYSRYDGRASMRTWLYKIATNVCLSALEPRKIRVLPSGLGGPREGPEHAAANDQNTTAPAGVQATIHPWLEPIPDSWLATSESNPGRHSGPDSYGDPAAVVIARESLRLALIASLQHLPARQRAILILREVLSFSAAETAQILGTTVAAVKSGLQRARARLDELDPASEDLLEPTDERARALLDAYITAFEHADAELLEKVLRADATLEATPFTDWRAGRAHCLHLLEAQVLGTPGDWRLLPTTANGQPAAAIYRRAKDGVLRADGIVVLDTTLGGVSRVVAFHDPELVALFGFPAATDGADQPTA